TVGVTGRDPDWREQLAPLVLQLDDVIQRLAVLAAAPRNLITQSESFSRRGADLDGVTPCEFRQRLRQFLQPAVVREAPVVNRRVGAEDDFERVWILRRAGRGRRGALNQSRRNLFRLECSVRRDAFPQHILPPLIEGRRLRSRLELRYDLSRLLFILRQGRYRRRRLGGVGLSRPPPHPDGS